jgi:aspartate ammonia-lyase
MAAESGQLQLNAFEPIIARSLMMSITYLRRGCKALGDFCIEGITANEDYLRSTVENSIGLVTVIAPAIGYENATSVAQYAQANNVTVKQAVVALGLLSEKDFDALLGDVDRLSGQTPRT